MATIYIDDQPYEVDATGRTCSRPACRWASTCPTSAGTRPCGSVGACRQCAVKQFKDENDTQRPDRHGLHDAGGRRHAHLDRRPRGARRSARSVIEWLMVNHPHDCPVCDEGGECHLQDMTVMTGHDYRRYRFPKRTYRNQDLGPFVNHEMNRCIQCYRCVRFYRDYAGGRDLDVFGCARPRLLRPRTRTACWRASSAATWSRSARPASSPTRR